MLAKEKYNNIVYKIEELVSEAEYMKDREISKKAFAAASYYIDDREKNNIFLFLMERSVIDYISERRMMAAYKYIISSQKPLYEKAISLSGVQNQPSFIKKFKKQFGITPTRAFKDKDESRLEPIRDWNSISQEGKDIFSQFGDNENVLREKKFGISKEMYIRARHAENLQLFYKLNDLEADFAFEFSDKYSVSMEESFEYVYNYVWLYAEEKLSKEKDIEKRDQRIKEDLLNDDTQYLYFDCGFSFEDIYCLFLIKHCNCIEQSLREFELLYLQGCIEYMKHECLCFQLGIVPKENIMLRYDKYQKAYQYFQKKKTEQYTEFDYALYIMLLSKYNVIALAWERLKPGKRNMRQAKLSYENICQQIDGQNVLDWYIDETDRRRQRLYEETLYEDEMFYGDDSFEEEYDMDDPDHIQDLYMSFEEDALVEDEVYMEFDEEYFEKLCKMEEIGQLNEDVESLRRLYQHIDLNVVEQFNKC